MTKLLTRTKSHGWLAALFTVVAGSGIILSLSQSLEHLPWVRAAAIVFLDLALLLGCVAVIRAAVGDRLEYYASVDPLTGILNRVSFWRVLEREIRRVERYRHPLALIMLDIDHLRAINDSFGSRIGDQVLKIMAGEIQRVIREIDLFGRIGGEEFLVLAPETDREKAVNLAEKLRETVAAVSFPEVGQVTVSLGVAQFSAGDRADLLLKKVDQALTQAKSGGRNRVACN